MAIREAVDVLLAEGACCWLQRRLQRRASAFSRRPGKVGRKGAFQAARTRVLAKLHMLNSNLNVGHAHRRDRICSAARLLLAQNASVLPVVFENIRRRLHVFLMALMALSRCPDLVRIDHRQEYKCFRQCSSRCGR